MVSGKNLKRDQFLRCTAKKAVDKLPEMEPLEFQE
jgi:hypothetical protein